ncbi:endonuclease MutS2 [Paenibacillus segetis]|uniref:Endonuclease MutS2 n=2 Tax=Paenibacillus segetis TaxID=1325360 RepID=A0ABQ1YW47_9BACL|nr:DNA mismatch repair protein MutS [Paenibacillus segetis]GGH38235.1 endonuclease MutS2 [Paenibacillus segetis]
MGTFNLSMLEYESVRDDLMRHAVSYEGRQRISKLSPMEDKRSIERAIAETAEANALLGKGSSIPLPSLEGIELVMSLMGTGYLFTEQDLSAVQRFLQSCGQLKKYMAAKGDLVERIGIYAGSLRDLPAVQQEILRCIHQGVISDQASRELEKVRRKIGLTKDKIQKKLQSVMSRYSSILQENLVSVRGGRYVIPVKKDFYKQVDGRMLDQSTSGQTVFIEPREISSLQSELEALQGEEAREESKILGCLTELVEREVAELRQNIEITGTYDFIFAKAKYGASIGGAAVTLSQNGATKITGAKHPLLLHTMVPLDLEIGESYKNLIITGPNTGGKTVVLKTFGLLALMVQSGLLVPVNPGSKFAVYSGIMAVIGDGQNMEQSLSTFSAQIQSLVHMLKEAGPSTLLLIDELAAGTDPGEGIALSIAILEEFSRKGATVMVTTHYNELKTFASKAIGFQNARMEFHTETLRPLYRLTIGEAGQSYAIEIAKKLGISADIVERSRDIVSRQIGDKEMLNLWDDMITSPPATIASPASGPKPEPSVKKEKKPATVFEVGDSVFVTSFGKYGIVSEAEDFRGLVEVMIQKRKVKVNKKRLKPHIKKQELYPDDYDLDIVLDSKENRKKRKLMSKRHVEGLEIIQRPGKD